MTKDALQPIKDVLAEITIWRVVNWNHAGADVCGEIERKLIAALRKVRKALSVPSSPAGR